MATDRPLIKLVNKPVLPFAPLELPFSFGLTFLKVIPQE